MFIQILCELLQRNFLRHLRSWKKNSKARVKVHEPSTACRHVLFGFYGILKLFRLVGNIKKSGSSTLKSGYLDFYLKVISGHIMSTLLHGTFESMCAPPCMTRLVPGGL